MPEASLDLDIGSSPELAWEWVHARAGRAGAVAWLSPLHSVLEQEFQPNVSSLN